MGLRTAFKSAAGFSLTDVMMAAAIGATMAGISVPMVKQAMDSMRLASATRDVERELQTARLRAVSKNRPFTLRLNCPAAGQYRLIEITGVPATDNAANRCDPNAFPYPGPRDNDPATPAFDGPVRYMHSELTAAGETLLFRPTGVTQKWTTGVTTAVTTPVELSLTRGNDSKKVTVNGLGKIQIK